MPLPEKRSQRSQEEEFYSRDRPTKETPPFPSEEQEQSAYFHWNNRITEFFSELGMDVTREKKAREEYSGPQKKNLRLVEISEDGKSLKNPFDDLLDYKSPFLMDKIRQGRILAFLPGAQKPVQVKYSYQGIRYSEPLDRIPEPEDLKPPKKLSGCKRAARFFTFGFAYKREAREAAESQQAYNAEVARRKSRAEDFRKKLLDPRTLEVLQSEKQDAERMRQIEDEKRKNAEKNELLYNAQQVCQGKFAANVELKTKTYRNLYGPTPQYQSYWQKNDANSQDLKALPHYQLPKEISGEVFTSLAMLNVTKAEFGGKFRAEAHPGVPGEVLSMQGSAFYLETLIGSSDGPRPAGLRGGILEILKSAREDTMKAVNAYRDQAKPDMKPLAEIIAQGMDFLLRKTEEKPLTIDHYTATMGCMGPVLDLLKEDPALKKEVLNVRNKEGKALVSEADLVTAKGFAERSLLVAENDRASALLEAEGKGACDLSDEERKKAIDTRLRYEALNRNIQNHIALVTGSPAYKGKYDQLGKEMFDCSNKISEIQDKVKTAKTEADKQKYGQEREKYHKRVQQLDMEIPLFRSLNIPKPEVYHALGKDSEKTLKGLVEKTFPDAEKLYGLKGKELTDALKPEKLFPPQKPKPKEPQKAGGESQQKTAQQNQRNQQHKTNNAPLAGG